MYSSSRSHPSDDCLGDQDLDLPLHAFLPEMFLLRLWSNSIRDLSRFRVCSREKVDEVPCSVVAFDQPPCDRRSEFKSAAHVVNSEPCRLCSTKAAPDSWETRCGGRCRREEVAETSGLFFPCLCLFDNDNNAFCPRRAAQKIRKQHQFRRLARLLSLQR